MRKIFILLYIFCFAKTFAQTQLNESFFVDTKSDDFKKGIVQIKEFVNFSTYTELQKLLEKGSSNINAEMLKKAYQTRIATFGKGKYIIDNDEHSFEFEINNAGQFVGIGKFTNKKKNLKSYYNFSNGKLSEIQTFNLNGKLLRKTIFKGNITESFAYDIQGNIAQKTETHTHLKEGVNQIYINYHKNGKPSKEVNTIKNITKEFYNDGKLKTERIEGKSSTTYNQNGKIITKRYVTDKGSCEESYENGTIQEKICEDRSISQTTTFTYKNGKLESYQVQDKRKKETRFYNAKNELLETKKQ